MFAEMIVEGKQLLIIQSSPQDNTTVIYEMDVPGNTAQNPTNYTVPSHSK